MNKLLIFSLVLFFSCNMFNSESFDTVLSSRWPLAEKVIYTNINYINSQQIIVSPPKTWQLLFSVVLGKQKDCLYYKIPHKEENGTLLLTTTTVESTCPQWPSKAIITSLDDIDELKVDYLPADNPSEIILSVKRQKQQISTKISFANLAVKKNQYELFESPVSQKKYGTFTLLGKDALQEVEDQLLPDGYICYLSDKNCKAVRDDCNRCRNGYYDAVSLRCKSSSIKICGIDNCGNKNQPACPRGEQFSSPNELDLCYENSTAGFCLDGLQISCGPDHYLICI